MINIRNSLLVAACVGASAVAAAQTIVDDSGTARNGKVGYWSSIVARHGDVAISYYCEEDLNNTPPTAYTLRFAWTTGATWQWTTVDAGGGDTCMARGGDGMYQIVYSSMAGIGWATGAATSWSLSSVPIPAELAPSNLSMVLDRNDRPHVAYMNFALGGDRSLRYVYYDGAQWVEGGANQGIVGTGLWTPTIAFSNTYLALDAAGTPHIAYAQPSDPINAYGPMQYATLTGGAGGSWQVEPLGLLGVDPSLAIGSDDVPRLVFNGDAGIVYGYRSGGVWQFETIVAAEWGSSCALALSDADVPVVSFGMTANEDMYIARRGAGGWVVTRVDGDGSSGPQQILGRYGTSVDVDETGVTHASYLAIDIFGPTHRSDLRYFGPGGGPAPCVRITRSPASVSACLGDTAGFSVAAESARPLGYQWRRGGQALQDGPTGSGATIGGATTADLTISGVTAAEAGSYDCVVVADCGSATSAAASLALASVPTILSSPTSASACIADTAAFFVLASGGALSYDWRKDGVMLADGPTGTGSTIFGAKSASLTISAATPADAGFYDCQVSNTCGVAFSAAAELTVRTCGSGCPGDLDGDGYVELEDLATLLAHFGLSGDVAPEDGDIDGDGDVDLADLATLLANYGSACP
jgi:Immunoglobulin I-set domain/Immunoglobulin domain